MIMKTYNNVNEYLNESKIGDYIHFLGTGNDRIMFGHLTKYDCYKVVCNDGKLQFKAYRGKKLLSTRVLNQKVIKLSDKEFKLLNK